MENKTILIGAGILLLLAMVGGFIVLRGNQSVSTGTIDILPSPGTQNELGTISPTPSLTPTKEIAISGGEYQFSPQSITLNKGDVVALTFKNSGAFPHDLVIDELGVTTRVINPGESDTVTFTADKAGTFSYYCNVDGHREKGMEGKVTVK